MSKPLVSEEWWALGAPLLPPKPRVIERTLSWLARMRRLTVRDERGADIHRAFLTLGYCLICFRALP